MNNNDENFFSKYTKSKTEEKLNLKLNIIVAICSTLIGVLILFGITEPGKNLFLSITGSINEHISNIHPSIPFASKKNILLIGVDSNGQNTDPFKNTRADTIILFNIDPVTKTVNSLSIPRDSKVYIAENKGVGKINSSHALGGVELTVKTIENMLGLKIDHYIVVNYDGIRDIIDVVGGIPVFVEKDMRYRDFTAGLNINLKKGKQILNSKEAEDYIRFRHDALGDLGRMHRQQWFLRGLAEKFQSPQIIPKLPEIIQTIQKNVLTDMNLMELSQYAAFLKSADLAKIQTAMLPGRPSKYGRTSYWVLDPEKTQEVIDRIVYRDGAYKKDSMYTVSILYTKKARKRALVVENKLEKAGYSVVCTNTTTDPHRQIYAHSSYASTSVAKKIRYLVPELKNAPFILAPNSYMCGQSDFSIVITENMDKK
ncbi:MAG: LCP family protein [Candidatus Gastranaerophilales bacterium]|nr:LCP family protein [Candidatus Gastranaerophilales bacterium]